MKLLGLAQCDNAQTACFTIHRWQQQFFMILGSLDFPKIFERQSRIHFFWLTNLAFLIEKIQNHKRSAVAKALWVSAAGFALTAPAHDVLASNTETFKKDVAVLVGKIEFACLLRRMCAEVHVPPVV